MRATSSTLLLSLLAAVSAVQAQNCDCWETHTGARFTTHKWFDFRQRAVPPYPKAPSVQPSPPTTPASEPAQAGFLTTAEFTDFWHTETWGRATISNSRANVFIAANNDAEGSSKLVLRNHKNKGWSTAGEISSIPKMKYGSFRIRARVIGDPGACAGMFTYQSDTQETDIEILTKDGENVIHYTNQGPGATTTALHYNSAVSWRQWHTHRIDWTEGLSQFFIDGMLSDTKTKNVPTETSSFLINMWNDDGVWTGVMKEGVEATLEILYMEFMYNNTESAAKKCTSICRVDAS